MQNELMFSKLIYYTSLLKVRWWVLVYKIHNKTVKHYVLNFIVSTNIVL